jgi:hypothetical protein
VSEFKAANPAGERELTRASASLPGLEIEIIHRRSPDGEAEQISINLQAVPSFEAFGRAFEAANPFVFWTQTLQLVWAPWLEAARMASLPFGGTPALPKAARDEGSRSSQ